MSKNGNRLLESVASRIMSWGLYAALFLLAAGMLAKGFRLQTVFWDETLLAAGLSLLLAVPVATVLCCFILFLKGREWNNAAFAGMVLAVIASGILFS